MDVDFRIEVGPGGADGYPVVYRTTDGEEASDVMRLPPPHELEALAARVPDAVVASSARVRRAVVGSEAPVRELGRMLFDALLGGAGAALLLAARNRAAQRGGQVRMVLRVQPPELARLPWEFLYDTAEDAYVCLEVPLVRHPQVARPVEPLRVAPPLRILGMVARPEDQEPLAVQAEQQRLREALADLLAEGRVELGWVGGQTWRDLRDAVRRDARVAPHGSASRGEWHVLHFIGHGGYDATAQEGTLALAGERGETYPLGAGQLAMLLAGHPSLRLAVLNACESGRAGELNPFSSVAGALMRKGMPAVLAMQYEVSEDAALECAHAFYDSLARQLPIDVAVMEARQAMTLARPGTLEWGTPVLYMRSLDGGGHLFDFADTPGPAGATPGEPGPGTRSVRPRPGERQADPRSHEGPAEAELPLEELYAEGLAALYTDRWGEAVEAFRAVIARDRDYRDSQAKLALARQRQRLASLYAAATAATAAQDWEQAVDHLEAVLAAEPGYRDARALLDQARFQRTRAQLREEIATLHRAGRWEAVLAAVERLRQHAPDQLEPEIVTMAMAARTELTAADRARNLVRHYVTALAQMEIGRWKEALQSLGEVRALDAGYRDTERLITKVRQEIRGTEYGPLAATNLFTATALHRVNAIEFSPDGGHLAVGTNRKTTLILDDRGTELAALQHGSMVAGVLCVRFTPDGRRFATASSDLYVRVWNAGTESRRFPGRYAVKDLVFSPDGRGLTAVSRREMRMWDTQTGRELLKVPHDFTAEGVDFSPDGLRFVCICTDGFTRVCDTATGTEFLRVKHDGIAHGVAFSPDSRRFATATSSGVTLWSAETGDQLLVVIRGRKVHDVAFSPDGRLLGTAEHDGAARVWDAGNGTELLGIPHSERVRAIAFAPDGGRLATAAGKTVHLWQLKEAEVD